MKHIDSWRKKQQVQTDVSEVCLSGTARGRGQGVEEEAKWDTDQRSDRQRELDGGLEKPGLREMGIHSRVYT